MADVFISYARADQRRIRPIAAALEAMGLTVWWDCEIRSGAEFTEAIERELEAADRVLVLWSETAIKSKWVRDEAGVGARNGTLLSASLDGSEPPLGFRQYHCVDLSKYRKGALPDALIAALDAPADTTHPIDKSAPRGLAETKFRRPFVIGGIALGILTATGLVALDPFDWRNPSTAAFSEARIAILPLSIVSDHEYAFLSHAIPAALVDGLSALPGLSISPASSVTSLVKQQMAPRDLADELAVGHLVEGDIQPLGGNRLAVSLRLLDPDTSEVLWTLREEGSSQNLANLQQRLVRNLGSALQRVLGVGSGDLVDSSEVNPAAYEAYLRGISLSHGSLQVSDKERAYHQFRRAAELDPEFAEAHAGLALTMLESGPQRLGYESVEKFLEDQRTNFERALEIDPNNKLARTVKAVSIRVAEGRIDEAIGILEDVLEDQPDYVLALSALARTMLVAGDPNRAITIFERGRAVDPTNPYFGIGPMHAQFYLGRYELIANSLRGCAGDCFAEFVAWRTGMAALANERQVKRDIDDLMAMLRNAAPEHAGHMETVDRDLMRALATGGQSKYPDEICKGQNFYDIAFCARTVSVDRALDQLKWLVQNHPPDLIAPALTDFRTSLPPEARADPRYHAIAKDQPAIGRIFDYRRKKGIRSGLPIDPDEIAAEKARLARARSG